MPVGGEALWIQGEDGVQVTEPELWALLLYVFFFFFDSLRLQIWSNYRT